MLESGWAGYDTETANLPSAAQGEWMTRPSANFDGDFWQRWGKFSTDPDVLTSQEYEDSLQEFYPVPYPDPLDDPLFDPEDDHSPP